jgi:hypothetical protein
MLIQNENSRERLASRIARVLPQISIAVRAGRSSRTFEPDVRAVRPPPLAKSEGVTHARVLLFYHDIRMIFWHDLFLLPLSTRCTMNDRETIVLLVAFMSPKGWNTQHTPQNEVPVLTNFIILPSLDFPSIGALCISLQSVTYSRRQIVNNDRPSSLAENESLFAGPTRTE